MEVRQYMTPEGLEEFILQDGAPVPLMDLIPLSVLPSSMSGKNPISSQPSPLSLTDDQLRSSMHRLVRVRCASCEEKS